MPLTRLPLLSLVVLGACYGSATLACFLAPYSFETQNRDLNLMAPTRVHVFDGDGRFHLRPFVYRSVPRPDGFAEYVEDKGAIYPIHFFVPADEYSLFGVLKARVHLFGVDKPARLFLLGSDVFGRDVFSRLLYGGQVSLTASLAAALISIALGMILGGMSGYYGRWADAVVMRVSDVFLAMPWLYLLLATRAALPLHMDPRQSY